MTELEEYHSDREEYIKEQALLRFGVANPPPWLQQWLMDHPVKLEVKDSAT